MRTDTSYLGLWLPHPFVAGASPFGYYVDTVKRLEDAGWAAVVLHSLFADLYEVATDLSVTGSAIEQRLCGLVTELTRVLSIPVAVKLSPFFAAFGNIAHRVDEAGAEGIVLFNRFYQPDIDTTTLQASPHVQLSTSDELLLRLRWLAILFGHLHASLAATGGVALPNDGVKAILAGADAVQMTSAILRNGPAYVTLMRRHLEDWMDAHDIAVLDDMRGLVSLQHTTNPAAFERANYIRSLQSWHRHQALPH